VGDNLDVMSPYRDVTCRNLEECGREQRKQGVRNGRFEVFTAVTMKNGVFLGLLRRVTLVRTDISEVPGASFIRMTRIGGSC
jgi:hypothetical protein